MRATVDVLKKVNSGELPFDRTIKVSLTERLTKEQIQQRMPHNLRTLEPLIEQNQADFDISGSSQRFTTPENGSAKPVSCVVVASASNWSRNSACGVAA